MFAEVYNNRGIAYGKKGQYDKAIFNFTKAIALNPRDAKAYNNRGICYHLIGQSDKAISDYNKAIEIDPMFAGAYYNRGIAYKEILKNTTKFCSDLKRACELGLCKNYELAKRNRECK